MRRNAPPGTGAGSSRGEPGTGCIKCPAVDLRDKLGTGAELALSSRRLVEEIAAARYSLRRVLALALETWETAGYVHLVEIYGGGCSRLVRLLKAEGGEQGLKDQYATEVLNGALTEVLKEWGRYD